MTTRESIYSKGMKNSGSRYHGTQCVKGENRPLILTVMTTGKDLEEAKCQKA